MTTSADGVGSGEASIRRTRSRVARVPALSGGKLGRALAAPWPYLVGRQVPLVWQVEPPSHRAYQLMPRLGLTADRFIVDPGHDCPRSLPSAVAAAAVADTAPEMPLQAS